MSALVLELQHEALNPHASVSNLLRKALVVARKLSVNDLVQWISSELNGYNDPDFELPAYRMLSGKIKVWNQFQGWQL